MENYRYVKRATIFSTAVTILLLWPFFVLAYSDQTTHPALTQETINFFNLNFTELSFTDAEKELVKRGSIDEDAAPRWLRHFYDPVYERGLWGQLSSKDWAKATFDQAGFASVGLGEVKELYSADSDYSWERAIYEYAWGDKERGLKTLGHILHLIQDASVPDHTRNDPHPPVLDLGSPYEHWTKQFDIQNIDIVSKLKGQRPIIFTNLDEYFNNLAKYSNNNFFSRDSIENYDLPKPIRIGVEIIGGETILFMYGLDEKVDEFRLAKVFQDPTNPDNYLVFVDNTSELLGDYWSRLSKQAVLHGAGVIKLFFDEIEKEKETKVLYNKNKTWAQKIFDNTKNKIFSFAATFYGSSVTSADLENDLEVRLPSGQKAVVATQILGEGVEEVERDEKREEAERNEGVEVAENEEGVEVGGIEVVDVETEEVEGGEENGGKKKAAENNGIRDQYGLVALPSGGGAIGGGGSSNLASPEPEPEEPADTTSPDLNFSIIECASSFSSGCLSTSTAATLQWSSTAEDLASYELNCETNGASCVGFPKTFGATSSVETSELLNDFTAYTFTVKAADAAGNQIEISKTIETASLPVVINEIAWMGTASSTEDEWLELKNNSAQNIDFAGLWILRAEDNTPSITLTGTVSAGGYYLLERKDDLTVSDVAADQTPYGNDGASWALNNGGERLFLERVISGATSTVDEVANCSNWCAGDNTAKKTMERVDSKTAGTSAVNWATAIGEFILNGVDASGQQIKGTPKSKNSVSFLVSVQTTISSDKTLTKQNSPYLIGRDDITVAAGSTLTIEPGVVIKFVTLSEPSLIISGKIIADGTAASPIVFTAFEDDDYGGDMNGDGICDPSNASSTAVCPVAGSWQQILIQSTSQNSSFANAIIRYGGRWFSNSTYKAMVAVDNTNATFDAVTVEYSNGHGLWLQQNSVSSVSNNSIFRNSTNSDSGLSPGAAGLRVAGGSPTINGNTFENNRYGIYISSAPQAIISSNTFNNNSVSAVESSGAVASFSANSGSGNAFNAVVLTGDITSSAVGTTTLKSNSLAYLIKNEVNVLASTTLAFEPQIVVKGHADFNNAAGKLTIKNGGKIFSNNSSASDLIFTSLYDDSAGGNTDNAVNIPLAGDWYGIVIEDGGILDMKGFTLRYAGGKTTGINTDNKAGLWIAADAAKIDTAVTENNFQNGIRFAPTANLFSVKNTTIRNHTQKVTGVAAGLRVVGADGTLENMTFSGNEKDIAASSGYSIDMSGCNCGSPSTDPNPL
ncbi:MAG: lamin tail domain-containing protein [Candidatus Niyogibacteria bacterium]|nr:MAG: lamin tail domain-containing protein [Candidatus Niyogibacteria bacterium]